MTPHGGQGATSLALFLVAACSQPVADVADITADRVFLNAAVYTVDADRSWAEAVAIADGRIVFVGNDAGAAAFIGEQTAVTDLDGQMLLPGFHDSHTHLLVGVATDEECDLLRIPTAAEVIEKVRECSSLEGFGEERWVFGEGWGDWLWGTDGPTKAVLDEIYPDRPVYLESSFSHSAWVNSRALELAGIHADTVVGDDGVIVRDPATGEATGTLRDSAMSLVKDIVPPPTFERQLKSVRGAIDMAHTLGVTAIIEPGFDAEMFVPVLHLADLHEFDLRAVVSLSPINFQPGTFGNEVFAILEGRDRWRRSNIDVDSVKIYMDGVIESGTGALLEPYNDASHGVGLLFYSQVEVNDYFTRFDAMGLQIHVHAIGDAAIRMALDGFESMRKANGVSGNRHHMTHLQLIHEDDIPRFAELDIGATFQTLWAYPDPAAIELDIPMIGEERTWQMYPLASIHQAGGRLVGASDFYVTDMDPLLAIEVGVTRQDPWENSGDILNADERVDLEAMLAAYTINGAYTMSLDDAQGSIEVGKRADFVVLDRNLFDLDPYAISDASVTMTIFDGRIVYQRPE